jgi:hypothetical protein
MLGHHLSVEQWLKQKDWLDSNLANRDMLRTEFRYMPRKGRQKELRQLWEHIHKYFKALKINTDRAWLSFFHASSGVGKSRLLYELMCKKDDDIPENLREFASTTTFLLVDFNDKTPAIDRNLLALHETLPLSMRLLYNCLKQNISWGNFVLAVEKDQSLDSTSLELENVLNVIRTRMPKDTRLVLLVDELGKSSFYGSAYPDLFRRRVCQLQDTYGVMAIFTTLHDTLMFDERTYSTRPVMIATKLSLLSSKDSYAILEPVLKSGQFSNRASLTTDHRVIAQTLARLSGGHARTIEYFVTALQSAKRESPILDHCISSAAGMLQGVYGSPCAALMLACILADPVGKEERVDELMSFRDCVASGQLIASFGDEVETFVPLVPPVFVHQWLQSARNRSDQLIVQLRRLVDSLKFWNPVALETVHACWEVMIRNCRGVEGYREITLASLYKDPERSGCGTELADIYVDGYTKLNGVMTFGTDADELRQAKSDMKSSYLWRPTSQQNAGFDLLMFYRKAQVEPSSNMIPLFIECKFSKEESLTMLEKAEVQSKHKACRTFALEYLSTDQFVVLFMCLRDVRPTAKEEAPAGCLFIDRAHAWRLYGPTLSELLHTVERQLDEVVVSSLVDV